MSTPLAQPLNTTSTTARQAPFLLACLVAVAGCRGQAASTGEGELGQAGTAAQSGSGGAGSGAVGHAGRTPAESASGAGGENSEATAGNHGGAVAGASSKPHPGEGGADTSGDGGEAGAEADAGGGGEGFEPRGGSGGNETSTGGGGLGGATGLGGTTGGHGAEAGQSGMAGQGGTAQLGGASGEGAGGMATGGYAPGGASSGGAHAPGGASSGGTHESGGAGGTAGQAGSPSCTFTVAASTSPSMPTVATVEWTTTLPEVASAEVIYALEDAGADILNRGGRAPVKTPGTSARTTLLGLKQESRYVLHVEAEASDGTRCSSDDYTLDTGTLAETPAIVRSAIDAKGQAVGFITTSGGVGSSAPVLVLDADGSLVWSAKAPASCSRARVDYDHETVWMLGINAANQGGDLRSLSLDGATSRSKLPGLERAHHDFTLLPGGSLAVFAWSKSGLDPESDLLEVAPDGSVKTLFHVGTNLYAGGQSAYGGNGKSHHCNSVTYRTADDSFVIGDRNPNLFVKVTRGGAPEWQFGGSCAETKAPRCVSGSWDINHGHHLLDDGTFVLFTNAGFGASTIPSRALEFKLTGGETMAASAVKEWAGNGLEHSDTLGDIQRLPNGNTLVTFSNNGVIYELDPSWNVVQTLSAPSFGYAEWRPTLYESPLR